jgi:hypothetical protein
MKLEAKVDGENVIISKNSFRYLLRCFDKQKILSELGAKKVWLDMQSKIDEFINKCKKIL